MRNKSLVGLTLAIAAGIVIAHIVTTTGDILFNESPYLLFEIGLIAVGLWFAALAIRKRAAVIRWASAHTLGIATAASLIVFPYLAGVYDMTHGRPERAANAFWTTLFSLGVFFAITNTFKITLTRKRRREKDQQEDGFIAAHAAPIPPQHPTR